MGLSLYARLAVLAIALAIISAIGWKLHHSGYIAGREEVRAEWSADIAKRMAATLAAERASAQETQRRLEAQKENQNAQNLQLAAARADADRNRADAERLRTQSADTARRWRDALGNSPTVAECSAAAAAIDLQTDVRSRMDGAASELAEYADTARTAGLKCQADYGALTPAH